MAGADECLVSGMVRTATSAMNGVLIYAFNNDRIDYFRQAEWCGNRIIRHLGLPVTIVTNESSWNQRDCIHDVITVDAVSGGQRRYVQDLESRSDNWFNGNRFQSYELSPYEQTLVLDSDYIVCSDQLLRLFESEIDVTVMKKVFDPTGRNSFKNYQRISDHRDLHHYWATVLYFRRSQLAEDFFTMMSMIRENYAHYSNIYQFPRSPFRNDFAASIALNTIYGHVDSAIPTMPWSMANVFSDVEVRELGSDRFELSYTVGNEKSPKKTIIDGLDFHFMNKLNLANLYEN
jgi:hypothetical protein